MLELAARFFETLYRGPLALKSARDYLQKTPGHSSYLANLCPVFLICTTQAFSHLQEVQSLRSIHAVQ